MNQPLSFIRINSNIDAAQYNNLGVDKCESGNFDESIANFSKAIQFKPKLAVLYFNRSLAFHKLGLPSAAKVDFETIQTLEQERHLFEEIGRFHPEFLEAIERAFNPFEA